MSLTVDGLASGLRHIAVALLILAGSVFVAHAHQVNLTTARIVLGPGGTVSVDVALKGSDVDRATGTAIFNEQTGLVDPERLGRSTGPISDYVAGLVVVMGADATPCATPHRPAVVPDGDGVIVRQTFSCKAVRGDLVYRSKVLLDVEPSARQVVLIGTSEDAPQALLDAGHTDVVLTAAAPSLVLALRQYLATGVEHIFLGYDHVAFLVAVVLWATRLWPVIKIVTAFTIAHSITLSLAALDVVVIPSEIVEPAIAASIVFVALENFFSRNVDRRWIVTFVFGLVHGFGFAGALQEFGLPRGAIVPALATFNIGVEIGQIAIVLIVVPVLIGLDRLLAADGAAPVRASALVYALSGTITVLGSYWLLSRIHMA